MAISPATTSSAAWTRNSVECRRTVSRTARSAAAASKTRGSLIDIPRVAPA